MHAWKIRIAELTIGLICSCLPSVNILIEHYKTPKYSPSTPRSRDSPGGRGRLIWGGLGTNVEDEAADEQAPTSGTRTTTTASSPQRAAAGDAAELEEYKDREPVDLRMELAMHPSARNPP
jgi:hypothetical protein